MRQNIRTIFAVSAALLLLPASFASADEAGPAGAVVPPPRAPAAAAPQPVSAPPPAFVELETKSISAGIGISWGGGTLTFEGRDYAFDLKGVSLLSLGASSAVSVGDVYNLENLSDFEGQYVAVEASGAAGVGRSALRMRNENGVVITLRSELQGVEIALATQGLSIALK